MAHFTCLAAARHRVLADAGWDVEADGLFGAPPIRVLVGAKAHTTVFAALRMLGMGSRRVELVAADDQGPHARVELARLLPAGEGPADRDRQVGEVNTGAIDAMPEIAQLAREHGAWCHVDGAFGLWAAASPALRTLVDGVGRGLVGHRRPQAAQRPLRQRRRDRPRPRCARRGDELVRRRGVHPEPQHDERYSAEWVPEFSRRARGFAVYAALRELGRQGIADLVERCCRCARMAEELARDPGSRSSTTWC